MIRLFFRRLDVRLSALIGIIIMAWLISFIYSVHVIKQERYNKAIELEKKTLSADIVNIDTKILNNLIMGHKEAVNLLLLDLYQSHKLNWLRLTVINDQAHFELGNSKHTSHADVIKKTYDIEFNSGTYAKLEVTKFFELPERENIPAFMLICGAILIMFIIFYVIRYYIRTQAIKPIEMMIKGVENIESDLLNSGLTEHPPLEIYELIKSFTKMKKTIRNYQRETTRNAHFVAIGQTASQIAHDIRKPLTSMKAILTMLPEIKDNPEVLNKFMADVDRNISQTNTMLSEILEFSSNSVELEIKKYDVQSLITAVLSDILRGKKDFNIEISYNLHHKNFISADINRMIRIFTNIVSNAVEAMNGKGKLFFGTKDCGDMLEMTVGNSGDPIPDNIKSNIFDPFFTKGKKGGTGLGLAICHKLIDLHNGNINVLTYPYAAFDEEATRFVIQIPALKGEIQINDAELIHHSDELIEFKEEEAARIEYGESKYLAQFMKQHKESKKEPCLLIMDDEPLFRETVRSLLKSIPQVSDHIKVIEAGTAEEALILFEECAFDYVIADIDLGKNRMNGYDFSRHILDKYPNTHVLIHSNKRRKELDKGIRSIQSDHFMGFLPKPMKKSELIQFLALSSFEITQDKSQAGEVDIANNKKNILIANDDTSLLLALKLLLKSQDVVIHTATTVENAMKHMKEDNIDLILSDINFGEGQTDGYAFLKCIREKNQSIPFYLVSGYNREEEEPKALKMGANGYFQQPIDPNELKKLI